MEDNDLLKKLKTEYENIKVSEKGLDLIKQSINKAKNQKKKQKKLICGAVASVITFVAIPNISPDIALAMSKIPVISDIVDVITLRNYTNEKTNVTAQVPSVQDKNNTLNNFNKKVDEYIKTYIEKFEKENKNSPYLSLDIDYKIVADRFDTFSLEIIGLEIGASGFQHSKVYNVNKYTGETFELKDIFKEGSDYVKILSDNIKEQMLKQMQEDENIHYWLNEPEMNDSNFKEIKPNQTFYIDNDNNLRILFEEYEIAPGYMGSPTFIINSKDIADILKIN